MTKKSKKTAKTAARKQIAEEAKIRWTGKENPFREGSAVFKRVELVRKASGRTRAAIERIRGVRGTTVPNLLRMKLVSVAA